MKNKILSLAVALAILFTGIIPMNVHAQEKQDAQKIAVYDGSGAFVGEFDSYEEFEREVLGINEDSKSVIEGLRWIVKIIRYAIDAYNIVELVSDLTETDIHGLIGEHVILPTWNGVQNFKLMSVSGGITNPYPANSYQYHQFYKTNFYWVEY